MAIDQHPRENLLLEATAYTRRCLFRVPRTGSFPAEHDAGMLRQWLEPFQQRAEWELFIGVRADERWSIYFDEQPVLQFNRQNQLRRLFAGSQLYAANKGRLRRLDRQHRGGQVQLLQVELDDASQRTVLSVCQQFVEEAAQALQSGRARRVGEFPGGDTAWLPAFEENLQRVVNGFTIAANPAH